MPLRRRVVSGVLVLGVAACVSAPSGRAHDDGARDALAEAPDAPLDVNTGDARFDTPGDDIAVERDAAEEDAATDGDLDVPSDADVARDSDALTDADADLPEHARCVTARALAGPVTLRDELLPPGTTSTTTCLPLAEGAELFYTITLPARQALAVTVSPHGSWSPAIRLLDACDAATCLASVDNGADELEETVGVQNSTDGDRRVVIAVGSRGPAPGGRFDLAVALRRAPVNVACAAALTVTDGSALLAQDASLAYETSSSCLATAPGGQLFYAATIPAGQTLLALVVPTGEPWNPVVRMLGSCSAETCLGVANDYLTGEAEAFAYTNRGAEAMPVVLSVCSNIAVRSGTFDLRLSVRAPLAHGACAAARVVAPGATVVDEWLPFAGSPSPTCDGDPPVEQLYYRVAVPGGDVLRATATPRAPMPWLPTLRLLGGCGAHTCLARSETGFGGDPQTLTWTNADAASREVVLAVGSMYLDPGVFDLALSVSAR
ncbi:MAG: hypothetical protein U0326_09355 [Polyangiales bacterium]